MGCLQQPHNLQHNSNKTRTVKDIKINTQNTRSKQIEWQSRRMGCLQQPHNPQTHLNICTPYTITIIPHNWIFSATLTKPHNSEHKHNFTHSKRQVIFDFRQKRTKWHTKEINFSDSFFYIQRTKYFELCLVDFEMCGPDILWQFSEDGAPRERHRQILIKMKKSLHYLLNQSLYWIE